VGITLGLRLLRGIGTLLMWFGYFYTFVFIGEGAK
jgi:hypothetical protein